MLNLSQKGKQNRYQRWMDGGNWVREGMGRGAGLGNMSVGRAGEREQKLLVAGGASLGLARDLGLGAGHWEGDPRYIWLTLSEFNGHTMAYIVDKKKSLVSMGLLCYWRVMTSLGFFFFSHPPQTFCCVVFPGDIWTMFVHPRWIPIADQINESTQA